MKKNIFILTILFLSCINTGVNAQQMIPGDIPTPNAASLGKYGDIPVSLFTGTPQISIPIHTLSVRGMELPITLDYDASGIMVNSLPSWVGQNWTLNAGGVIVRQQNGGYDEHEFPSQAPVKPKPYFRNYSEIRSYVSDGNVCDSTSLVDRYFRVITDDMSPDIFTFHFLGKSGKFFLGNDGEWKVFSKDNLDIIFDVSDDSNYISPFRAGYPKAGLGYLQPKVIKGFVIRDEEGNEYHFGGTADSMDFTTSLFNMSVFEDIYSLHPTAWYLTKVKDRHGNTLFTLEYERGPFFAQFFNSWGYKYYRAHMDAHFSFYTNGMDEYRYHIDYEFPYGGTFSAPTYLKHIKTPNGQQVDFNSVQDGNFFKSAYSRLIQNGIDDFYYNMARRVSKWSNAYNPGGNAPTSDFYNRPGAFYYLQTDEDGSLGNQPKKDLLAYMKFKQLATIDVNFLDKDDNVTRTKRYILNYSNPTRLKLDSIRLQTIKYGPPTDYEKYENFTLYRFKYNNFEKLPSDYLSRAVDHWGYYNGSEYPLPYNIRVPDFKTSRDPNPVTCMYGMLSEIIYPTGGCSVIEYEPNQFSKSLSHDKMSIKDSIGYAGGVRVKSITEYDDMSHSKMLKCKTYRYSRVAGYPSSGILFTKPIYNWPDWHVRTSSEGYVDFSIFRTTSIIPLSNSFGPNLGYSYVEEAREDGSKTTYEYSNADDPHNRDYPFDAKYFGKGLSPYDMTGVRNFMRGNLLKQCVYNPNGAKTSEIEYEYRTDDVDKYSVLTSNMGVVKFNMSDALKFTTGGVYRIFYPKYDVVKEVRRFYGSDGNYTETTTRTMKDTTLTVTFGGAHKTDIRKMYAETITRGSRSMTAVYRYPYMFGDDDCYTDMACKKFYLPAVETDLWENGLWVKKNKTVYRNNNGIVPLHDIVFYDMQHPDTLATYTFAYDGNITGYKEKGKPWTHFLWSFTGEFLYAKYTGSFSYAVTDFPPGIFHHASSLISYFNDKRASSNALITSYTYDNNFKVNSVTDPGGNTTYYEYDLLGRLVNVKDNNGNITNHYEYNYRK